MGYLQKNLKHFQSETLRIANHTVCRFAKKRVFPLASSRAALFAGSRSAIFKGKTHSARRLQSVSAPLRKRGRHKRYV